MMTYLTRQASLDALKKMKIFHKDLIDLYGGYGLDLLDNLGRRNVMLSNIQEKFFANELAKTYSGVSSDGRTGEPDIMISEISKELECKLTSRQRSGTINFQTDHDTLVKKKELDYLYVVAGKGFNKFAALYFEGLTTNDFRHLSNGARGKVSMCKHKAMSKCTVLVGDVIIRNEVNIKKSSVTLSNVDLPQWKRQKAQRSIKYWKSMPPQYSIILEEV